MFSLLSSLLRPLVRLLVGLIAIPLFRLFARRILQWDRLDTELTKDIEQWVRGALLLLLATANCEFLLIERLRVHLPILAPPAHASAESLLESTGLNPESVPPAPPPPGQQPPIPSPAERAVDSSPRDVAPSANSSPGGTPPRLTLPAGNAADSPADPATPDPSAAANSPVRPLPLTRTPPTAPRSGWAWLSLGLRLLLAIGVIEAMPDQALFSIIHLGPRRLLFPRGRRLQAAKEQFWPLCKSLLFRHLDRSSAVFAILSVMVGGRSNAEVGWCCYGIAILQYLAIGLIASRDKAIDVLTEFDRALARRREALERDLRQFE